MLFRVAGGYPRRAGNERFELPLLFVLLPLLFVLLLRLPRLFVLLPLLLLLLPSV